MLSSLSGTPSTGKALKARMPTGAVLSRWGGDSPSRPRLITVPHRSDRRGSLGVLENGSLPFTVQRAFFIHGVPQGAERGGHAHFQTEQLVVTLAGEVRLEVTDGHHSESFLLADAEQGLLIPVMTWTRLTDFSANAVVLVLCNTVYEEEDYIRDWKTFQAQVTGARPVAAFS